MNRAPSCQRQVWKLRYTIRINRHLQNDTPCRPYLAPAIDDVLLLSCSHRSAVMGVERPTRIVRRVDINQAALLAAKPNVFCCGLFAQAFQQC